MIGCRWMTAAMAAALLIAAPACGRSDPPSPDSEPQSVDFVAVAAPQFGGGEETGQWSRRGETEWRIDDAIEPALALYLDETYDGVFVEFAVTVEQGDDASIVLAYTGGSYYYLGVGSFHHQYFIARQDQGQPPRLLAAHGLAQDIEPKVEMRLGASIVYEGLRATLVLTVDDRMVLEYTDYTPLPGGHIGLRAFRTMASFRLVSGPE